MFENNSIMLFIMITIPILSYLMISESELNKIKEKFSGINVFKPLQYIFILFSTSNILLIYYSYTNIWYKNIYLILFNYSIMIFTILMSYFIFAFCFLEKDKNVTFINLISFSSLCLGQVIVQFSVIFKIYNKDELICEFNKLINKFNEFNIFGKEFILLFFSFLFLMSLLLLFETYFKNKIKVNFIAILFGLRIILMSIIIALFIDNLKYEKSKLETINSIHKIQ